MQTTDTTQPFPSFKDRLRRRNEVWWNTGRRLPDLNPHRFLDRVQLRSRHAPLEKWSCCDSWQRCLLNKWNSREFAALHGVAVPELYWSGRDAAQMPIGDFPEHFVIRPAWGTLTRGTHVVSGTTDLVDGHTYKDREELKSMVVKERGRFGLFPLLVEEFMTTPEAEYASGVEYKFFMFGSHVGAIRAFHRRDNIKWVRDYTADWKVIEEVFQPEFPLDAPIPRPPNLEQMTEIAKMLGGAFGTFVRVDLYSTSKGVYFGEFSSAPGGDNKQSFTPFANDYLGRLWQDHIPDRI